MGCLGGCIAGLLFTVLEVVALVMTVVGTPLAMFKPTKKYCQSTNDYDKCMKTCYTLWGYKEDCSTSTYLNIGLEYDSETGTVIQVSSSHMDAYGCDARIKRIKAASALAVSACCLSLFLVIIGLCMMCSCCKSGVVPGIFCFLSFLCTLACFALVANIYHHKYCEDTKNGTAAFAFKEKTKYGEGFALIVTGFAVQFLNFLMCLLMC